MLLMTRTQPERSARTKDGRLAWPVGAVALQRETTSRQADAQAVEMLHQNRVSFSLRAAFRRQPRVRQIFPLSVRFGPGTCSLQLARCRPGLPSDYKEQAPSVSGEVERPLGPRGLSTESN